MKSFSTIYVIALITLLFPILTFTLKDNSIYFGIISIIFILIVFIIIVFQRQGTILQTNFDNQFKENSLNTIWLSEKERELNSQINAGLIFKKIRIHQLDLIEKTLRSELKASRLTFIGNKIDYLRVIEAMHAHFFKNNTKKDVMLIFGDVIGDHFDKYNSNLQGLDKCKMDTNLKIFTTLSNIIEAKVNKN
ncbi:MAG: hypothetical protein JZU53_16720 [Paludibacter sp.]|nr:hypothetical protein [Paludibacter sp.]